jgi:hypothetical protein
MPDYIPETKWGPFFEELERNGTLTQLLAWLSEQDAAAELEYRKKLRTVVVTNRKSLSDLWLWQGRLSGFAHLRGLWKALGQRKTQPLPKIERRLTSA